MRWLRLYDDTINDPKVLKLPEAMRWHWIALLCVASKSEGVLPPLDDIAIQLRVTAAKATEIIAALVKAQLLDKMETGFAPHNWNGRQYKSDVSTERVKRFRNGKRNVSETVSETVCSVSVSESVSGDAFQEEEKKKVAPSSDFEFEDFWNVWPNKVGKPAALRAFVAARKRAGLDAIVEGVFAYIRDKPPDRPWLNPATFLNQNRWEDQPAQVQYGKTPNSSNSLIAVLKRDLAALESEDGPDYALPDSNLRRISG